MSKNQFVKTATELILSVAERRLTALHGRQVSLTMEVEGEEVLIDPENIIESVSYSTGVPVKAMKSPSRKREVTEARHIAMALIKESTRASYKRIGKMFGGRDHSTVIHARQTVEDLCDTSKQFQYKYNRCRQFAVKNISAGVPRKTLLLNA